MEIKMIDFKDYKRARLYTSEKNFIGEAVFFFAAEGDEDELTLRVSNEVMDRLYTHFIITFVSEVKGLATYSASMIDFIRESGFKGTYKVRCRLLEVIETLQRRQNFKIKVKIPMVITLCDPNGKPIYVKEISDHLRQPAEIRDLSASGILFVTSKEELEIGQQIEFTFEQADQPFPIKAEIVRRQDDSDGTKGYGCRFIDLPEAYEAGIRRYIFNLQLAIQKRRMY